MKKSSPGSTQLPTSRHLLSPSQPLIVTSVTYTHQVAHTHGAPQASCLQNPSPSLVPCTEIAMRLGGSQNKCALSNWCICGSFKLAAGAGCVLPHRFFCVAMLCLKDTKASLRVCFSYLSLSLFKPVWRFISLINCEIHFIILLIYV